MRRIFLLLALLLSLPTAHAAQAQEVDNAGGCLKCITRNMCTSFNEPGVGANACTVTASGCQESLSFCIIAERTAMHDLRLETDEFLRLDSEGVVLAMAPVGDGRFAAWSCSGELIRLVERRRDGSLRTLDTAQHRATLHYARVVRQAHRNA